jgi:hypothetical protein
MLGSFCATDNDVLVPARAFFHCHVLHVSRTVLTARGQHCGLKKLLITVVCYLALSQSPFCPDLQKSPFSFKHLDPVGWGIPCPSIRQNPVYPPGTPFHPLIPSARPPKGTSALSTLSPARHHETRCCTRPFVFSWRALLVQSATLTTSPAAHRY